MLWAGRQIFLRSLWDHLGKNNGGLTIGVRQGVTDIGSDKHTL